MGIARPSFTRFCVALAGAFPTRESVLRPIAGSGLLSQTGDIAERIAISNRMNIFSDGVSRGEIIKPVWREKVCAVVCWGRGCTNGVTPEHCGSRMAATPPTSRARLFPSQWHRRQSSSPLTATMHPTPQTTREPHLPASRKALRLQAWLSADATPSPFPAEGCGIPSLEKRVASRLLPACGNSFAMRGRFHAGDRFRLQRRRDDRSRGVRTGIAVPQPVNRKASQLFTVA